MTENIRMSDVQPGNVALTGDQGLAIAVQAIDLEKETVRFAVHPVFAASESTPGAKPFASRESRIISAAVNDQPVSVLIDGIVYQVTVKAIGKAKNGGAFCDFEVVTTLA